MEAGYLGIYKSHAPGFFCRRVVGEEFFFGYFETNFLYEHNGQLLQGYPGDMLVIPPGEPVYLGTTADAPTGYTNDWIYLSGKEVEGLITRYPIPLGTAFPVGNPEILRPYIENVIREDSVRMPGYPDQLLFMTGQLIITLHRICGRETAQVHSTVEKARETIMRAPERPWTLEQMAQLCSYSPSRFSALYKERFGVAPKQDLLEARVEMASRMLRYTDLSVTEIADHCGFRNIYYFSKYFKAIQGQTPTQYRK